MDSLTHIALGAVIGDAFAGKALGKKAMVIGAVAQCLPDCDFILSVWLRPVDNLLAHRGFTHSILFCLAISLLLSVLTSRWQHSSGISGKKWFLFFVLQISIHLLLDSLNSYGVGWFEPFSHLRVAFDVIYVADPFYSIWLGIAFVVLLILKRDSALRKRWIMLALALSSIYLLYTLCNKVIIDIGTKSDLEKNGITSTRIFTTPTPLNNWLWFIAAESDSGYHVGYRSVFDGSGALRLTYFPRHLSLLNTLDDKEDFQKLLRFSDGYYTIEKRNDALLFNDLRFGQIAGWGDPHAMFAFHYDLLHPDANLFVVQQGRFSNWNWGTVKILFRRISGKKVVG